MNPKTKRIVNIIVIAVIAWLGYKYIISPQESQKEAITIGFIGPLTGEAVSYGESERNAVEVAVEEINAQGGINGKELKVVYEDGNCNAQPAGTAAQRLISINKVKVIIGGACSSETLAAAKTTEPEKVILLSPSASSPDVTGAGDFLFRTYPSDALAGKIASSYAFKELGVKKAALITELTDYAKGLRTVYKESFTALGGEIVADETYTTGDTDFRTQILKIKSSKPDVVYVVPQTTPPGLTIIKQLRENGVQAKITTAEVLLDRQIVKDNVQTLEGVIGVEVAVDYVNNPKAKAFFDAHKAKFNKEPGSFAANAYDAAFIIAEALKVNGTDTEKIRDWLYALKDWEGAVGKITFDSHGDPIMSENVRRIENGEVKDLGPYNP